MHIQFYRHVGSNPSKVFADALQAGVKSKRDSAYSIPWWTAGYKEAYNTLYKPFEQDRNVLHGEGQ